MYTLYLGGPVPLVAWEEWDMQLCNCARTKHCQWQSMSPVRMSACGHIVLKARHRQLSCRGRPLKRANTAMPCSTVHCLGPVEPPTGQQAHALRLAQLSCRSAVHGHEIAAPSATQTHTHTHTHAPETQATRNAPFYNGYAATGLNLVIIMCTVALTAS